MKYFNGKKKEYTKTNLFIDIKQFQLEQSEMREYSILNIKKKQVLFE